MIGENTGSMDILHEQPVDAMRLAEVLKRVVELIGSGLGLEPLLGNLLESAVKLVDAGYGMLGLVIDQAGEPVVCPISSYPLPPGEREARNQPGSALAALVLAERKPVILACYGDLSLAEAPALADHAAMGMPFWTDGQMTGVLCIWMEPPRQFNEQDIEALALFVQYAAVAIQNARLIEAQQHRAARVLMTSRIGQLINSSLSLEQILQTAVDAINEHLNYPSVALLLSDVEDPQTLVLSARGGIYAQRVIGEYRQRADQGIIGAAASTRQRVLIPNVHRDPRYIPIPGAEYILSELAVPIVAGERLLGVLNIESELLISAEDAEGFQMIADQLGVAIDNARRYEEEKRRTERMDLIARLGNRIAARLDPGELFDTTVEDLHKRLGYEHVSLFLIDPAQPDWLVQQARASRWPRGEAQGYRQQVTQGILGAAVQSREPVCVDDVNRDNRYIAVPNAGELRAELAVPIKLGERLLGVLDLAGSQRFQDEDISAIQIIADQLAVAIDNSRLFAATQRALEETRLLYETSQRISLAQDVSNVIAAYLEQVAVRGRYACNVVLYEFDEHDQRTAIVVHGRWTAQEGLLRLQEKYPYTRDALDPPLDAGQTITITDVHRDPRASPELRRIQERDQRPSLAMIPLIVRGRRIGLVVLSSPFVHEWSESDLRPYQATAAQLATAIDHRQNQLLLYERGQQVAVLEERQRLARELHDSVTQLIFSTTLIAQSITPAWKRSPSEGEQRVNRLLELSQEALREMRALLFELHPPSEAPPEPPASGTPTSEPLTSRAVNSQPSTPGSALQPPLPPDLARVRHLGLPAALRQLAGRLDSNKFQIEIETQGYPAGQPSKTGPGTRPPASVEEALFRIAQESLNNIVKHARARHVRISIRLETGEAHLIVKDDGLGFVPAQIPSSNHAAPMLGGLGLKTMQERAIELGGRLQIISAPGQGTTVQASIPWETGGKG